ncbi:hypothetical protein PCE1_004335 [Barthelona sp. PCE]
MGKHTKKVGIVGRYGTRYGTAAKKILRIVERNQSSKYTCPFCGKDAVKRQAVGVWKCKGCTRQIAGAAYTLSSSASSSIRSFIRRYRDSLKN